jgi:transcription antitermination factor NusG
MSKQLAFHISKPHWYALRTRSRQEKTAASMLTSLQIPCFLPLKSEMHQWSDRKKTVEVPLFSCYVFVYLDLARDQKLRALKVPGIIGFVGNSTGPIPIPDAQINSIQTVLVCDVEYSVEPFIREGDKIRVVRGALAGVEGTLVQFNSTDRLLISIEVIHYSLAVSISRCDVQRVESEAA